jgi:hypothetical protein
MNGFTENRASGASERPGDSEKVMTWDAGVAMLPLVGRIAADVLRLTAHLNAVQPELARLDRKRRTLDWPSRARRYQLQEDAALATLYLQDAYAELEVLGVALLDGDSGLVGFPTLVNNRRAFFSWKPGEEGLKFWNYSGELARRPVPDAWTKPTPAPKEKTPRGKKANRG